MRETVLFPEIITPVLVGREKSRKLVNDVMSGDGDKLIALVALRDATVDDPQPVDLYQMGTVARIVQKFSLPDGNLRIVVQGVARAHIKDWTSTDPWLEAEVDVVDEVTERTPEVEALVRSVLGTFQQMVELAPYMPDQLMAAAINISSAESLADFLASSVNVELAERQDILETVDVTERLRKVARILNRELDLLQTGAKINEQMASELDKGQREFFLRRQLDAIRKELGEVADEQSEIDELRRQIDEADPPEAVKTEAEKEIARLEKIPAQSPEHTVIRSYLDWIAHMPWTVRTDDTLDVAGAQQVLDADHYGLDEVKERILEFLAVRALKADQRGPILCFVGPPGVGKTSLGQSIARALGRKFVRMSLGGVRD